MDEKHLQAAAGGRGGRRKGSGKRAEADAPWEFRAVQALGDPSRWAIVRLLSTYEETVGEIARRVGLSIATTSRHISILIDSEVVASSKVGRMTVCRLAPVTARAGLLLRALGIEALDGLRSGPSSPDAELSVTVPEFAPSRSSKNHRYQAKDMDDFLL